MKSKQHKASIRNKPAIPVHLPIRFPIKEGQRMLPDLRHQLAPELQDLQYSAQEVVCQICRAYRERESSEARHSLNAQRRRLNTIATRLAAKGLTNEQKLLAAAEEIRSIHRPLGAPGSVSEVMQFLGGGDYFAKSERILRKNESCGPGRATR